MPDRVERRLRDGDIDREDISNAAYFSSDEIKYLLSICVGSCSCSFSGSSSAVSRFPPRPAVRADDRSSGAIRRIGMSPDGSDPRPDPERGKRELKTQENEERDEPPLRTIGFQRIEAQCHTREDHEAEEET